MFDREILQRATRGQLKEPGILYEFLRRRDRRVPLYRRPEVIAGALVVAWSAVCWFAGIPAMVHAMAGYLGLCTWVLFYSRGRVRSMLDTGFLEELLLTPAGVLQYWADICLLCVQKVFPPTITLLAFSVLLALGGFVRSRVHFCFAQFYFLFVFLPLASAILGAKLGLGIVDERRIARAAWRGVLRFGPFVAMIGLAIAGGASAGSLRTGVLISLTLLVPALVWAFVVFRRPWPGAGEAIMTPPDDLRDGLERALFEGRDSRRGGG